MSYQSKKFCGVCHKAGKTESEYTSHYTKSEPGSKGIVTCPIIKNNKCNKCGKYGHFQDYCSYKKNHDLKISNHDFEKPRKKIVLEPTYDELFPALGGSVTPAAVVGVKRSRDNNQYNVLQNQMDCVDVKPVLSYKIILEKEPVFVSSDSDSLSSFTDLHHYKKKYSSNHSFIHDDVDVSISKRILPVEIDESLLNDFSDDDEDWDGSWY